ncbi:unnamed protein product [Urochloa decumbens]|uniref:Uncharacterized protein n=1 Tax=Urochloa decumbens TaxID=240449 RepID=A0ABC8WYU4_9POAL
MPPAVAGEPLRSASSIVPDTARGYHLLKIDGYSLTKDATPTGKRLDSHPFTLGGHRWYIRYYPNGTTSESKDYVSIFLHLAKGGAAPVVKARFQLRFATALANKALSEEEVRSFDGPTAWGHIRFIKRAVLEKSEHLKDDSFTVRCDLLVINEFRAEEEKADVTTPVFVSVPPSNLRQQLGHLLLTEKGANVVFEVGGETFAAHRCVLAARSPVFSAELFGTMKESDTTGVIRIEDMEAQAFKALLHYMYTDSLPKTKKRKRRMSLSQHLLVASDRYNLERLKLICEKKLCRCIDVGTVASILALAEQHHCHGLKKACLSFLCCSGNLNAVMATEGFDHLSTSCPSVVKELISMLGT